MTITDTDERGVAQSTRNRSGAPRLLFVTTASITLRSFLLPIASFFRAIGWRVDALAAGVSSCPECTGAFDHVWEIDWSRNAAALRNWTTSVRRVQGVVRSGEYDIVHAHTPIAGLSTRLALRSLHRDGGPKVVYTAHGFRFYQGNSRLRNALYIAIEKIAGRWTDRLVVINQEDAGAAASLKIASPDKIVFMPGIGIDPDWYQPDYSPEVRLRFREQLGIQPDEAMFTMIAEFIPRKRHHDALQAFSLVSRRHRSHLVLVGDGPLLQATREKALECGGRVHFLGYRKDVRPIIAAADASLLSSDLEGLPRSVLESMALATPVIATRARGSRDLLDLGVGISVPVGDPEALANAMIWMHENPAQAREMGLRGRANISRFALSKILQLHNELYTGLLGSGLDNLTESQ